MKVEEMAPAPRALATLAALPAPVKTPQYLTELIEHDPFGIKRARFLEALQAGTRSVPTLPEGAMEKKVEEAINLALSALSSAPAGLVGTGLFVAQVAGIVTGVAAIRANDPELLQYANGLRKGAGVVDSLLSSQSYVPLVSAAADAVLEHLQRPPEELAPVVMEAAAGMAALPPGKPG